MAGGTAGLLGLIKRDRGAVEYDLRQRFGLGLRDVGERITLAELARLVAILRNDPSSMIAASIEGWNYPMSREAAIFADLYDLQYAKTGAKKRIQYPRPWKRDKNTQRYGNTGGRTRAEVIAILNAHGHALAL